MNSCQKNLNNENQQAVRPLTAAFFTGLILSLCFALPVLRSSDKIVFIQAGKLNPNDACVSELAQLPSIGEKKAQAIIDYRISQFALGKQKAFERADDLENVRGMGKKTVDKIKRWLEFD